MYRRLDTFRIPRQMRKKPRKIRRDVFRLLTLLFTRFHDRMKQIRNLENRTGFEPRQMLKHMSCGK